MLLIVNFKKFLESNILNISLLLILFNAALNFIGPSSYVRGVLVDYLIFRIYISQIVILFLVIVFYERLLPYKKHLVLILVSLFLLILTSSNPQISLSYIARRFIYIPFVFILFGEKIQNLSLKLLTIVNITYLVILLVQFLLNSNIFPYFPFGFYPFQGVGVRLDYFSWFGYKKVIPLGNFPHPNLFAAFFSLLNTIYLFNMPKKVKLTYFLVVFNILSVAFLGSFSALLFNILLIIWWGYKKYSYKYIYYYLIFIPLSFLTYQGSFKISSIYSRLEQYKTSIFLLKESPFLGVGLGNYIPSILSFEKYMGSTFELQPVHNIFVLVVVELGFVGSFIFLFFLFKKIKYLKPSPFLLFICLLGISDHFLITLNQGLLLLALTIFMHKSIISADAK